MKKEKTVFSKRKNIKEMESIRNIIRLLILETIIPLYILFMSLIYGEGIKSLDVNWPIKYCYHYYFYCHFTMEI